MATNVDGFGFVGYRTADNKYVPFNAVTFSLTSEPTFEDVNGRPIANCGKSAVLDTVEQTEVFTLTLGAEKVDKRQFDFFAFGAEEDAHPSISVPVPTAALVPATGVIVVGDIVPDQVVGVTVLSDTAPGNIYLTQQPTGTGVTPANHEAGTGTVTVDATYAGSTVMMWYFAELTNQSGIGGNLPVKKITQVETFGKICGAINGESNIYIPKAINTSGVNADATIDTLTKALRPVIDTARGMQAEYFKW